MALTQIYPEFAHGKFQSSYRLNIKFYVANGTIQACWQTYETFVLCSSFTVGLLQFIVLNFQDTVRAEHRLYLRTQSRDLPSEKSVKQIIAQLLMMQFFQLGQISIIQQI